MKLLTKLTLFITFSKLLIVVLFVLLLPSLVKYVSFRYSNYYLVQQKKKVLDVVKQKSIDYYLQGDSAYGSYTMLKEEYISILPADLTRVADTIETSQRIIEGDTLNYRVLTHQFHTAGANYRLEIGKTTATIGEYNLLLQRFTLFALIVLIVLSIIIDLVYTNILLRPLAKIVRTKLLHHKFPFKDPLEPVKTSTTDFRYLDSSLISLMEQIHDTFYKEREFTSNASHELMTPISILQTNMENMMLDEQLSEAMLESLAGMMKTVNRLKRIVHSLLYISRIENDQYAKNDTVSLQLLSGDVMEELSARMEVKSIQFTTNISPTLQVTNVNHDLFFQMLYNLVNNAIRYNKESGSIQVKGQFIAGGLYELTVEDTGIGIREEELPYIFNRFKKSSNSEGEGYGLGLSIVKSIVVFHGFEINVRSVFDVGTIFSIVIPANMVNI